LADTSGRHFGFETTLFKFTHLHVPGSKTILSVDKADVAFTDVSGRTFVHSVSYLEPGLSPIALSSRRFSEQLGPDRIWSTSGAIRLRSASGGTLLRLSMTPAKPALLEGGTGIVPMGSHGTSYYYSYPKLVVRGSIHYQHRWHTVKGIAWFDHQWGSWSWSDIRGWTWGAFQLNNGVDFSASIFRTAGRGLHGATASMPGGSQRTFAAVRITPTGYWHSHATGVTYGSGWIVTIPGLHARLTVRPLLRDQLVYDSTLPAASYWEGDCAVTGTLRGRLVQGDAYMELVGGSRRFQPA
jgi:predicted secreted hydrolase